MPARRAIEMALDLARMPAIASSMYAAPLPPGILDVIRIAAEAPEACQEAALATGKSEQLLIEAARFYLQQVLFREGADAFRVLGIKPDDTRAAARVHMRWLLQWLHPDHNGGGWDSVYAKRIVQAWRDISTGDAIPPVRNPTIRKRRNGARRIGMMHANSFRIPLIARPYKLSENAQEKKYRLRSRAMVAVTALIGALVLLMGLSAPASTLRIVTAWW